MIIDDLRKGITNEELLVIQYMQDNFDLDEFEITRCKLFPYGYMLTDADGEEIVIYWDILQETVKTMVITE